MKKIFASLLIASMLATSFAAEAGAPPTATTQPAKKITFKQWEGGIAIICATVICSVKMRMDQNSTDPVEVVLSPVVTRVEWEDVVKEIVKISNTPDF